jgi:TRAP-type C4-dicarboxylate transport system permease small subunit
MRKLIDIIGGILFIGFLALILITGAILIHSLATGNKTIEAFSGI